MRTDTKMRVQGWTALSAAEAAPLEPFDVMLTIDNKREILDKKATVWFGGLVDFFMTDKVFVSAVTDQLVTLLPPGLASAGIACVLTKKESVGLVARIGVQITGYDLRVVLSKAHGYEFADAVLSLQDTLAGLGMPDQFAGISAKVGQTIRASLMRKIPGILEEKLGEQGIKASVVTDPSPPPEEPLPGRVPAPSMEQFYRVRIPSREPLIKQVGMTSSLGAAALYLLPTRKLMEIICRQMEQKISDGVRDTLGEALRLTVKTVADDEVGDDSKTDSFWLTVTVDAIDVIDLLKHSKGEDFASHFAKLLQTLETLQANGVESIPIMSANMYASINSKVLEGLSDSLTAKLKESVGAEVTQVSAAGFTYLQEMAGQGRCCASNAETFWWVAADQAVGSGMFGMGYGRSGRCPPISPIHSCRAGYYNRPLDVVQSKHTSFTACFHLGKADDPADITRLVARDIITECVALHG